MKYIWGNPDFEGIDLAAEEIANYLAKWGRITILQYKSKFQTVRVYMRFGCSSLLNLIDPFAHYYHGWPKWAVTLDIYVLGRVVSIISGPLIPYQKWIYRKAHIKAIAKRPWLAKPIIYGADYPELLEGLLPEKD